MALESKKAGAKIVAIQPKERWKRLEKVKTASEEESYSYRENVIRKINIRYANFEDVEKIAELIAQLKKLHCEFDPILKEREDLLEKSKTYIEKALKDEKKLFWLLNVRIRL